MAACTRSLAESNWTNTAHIGAENSLLLMTRGTLPVAFLASSAVGSSLHRCALCWSNCSLPGFVCKRPSPWGAGPYVIDLLLSFWSAFEGSADRAGDLRNGCAGWPAVGNRIEQHEVVNGPEISHRCHRHSGREELVRVRFALVADYIHLRCDHQCRR